MTERAQRVVTLFQSLEPREQAEVATFLARKSGVLNLLEKGMSVGPSPMRRRTDDDFGIPAGPFPGGGVDQPQSGYPAGPSPAINRKVQVCPSCGKRL